MYFLNVKFYAFSYVLFVQKKWKRLSLFSQLEKASCERFLFCFCRSIWLYLKCERKESNNEWNWFRRNEKKESINELWNSINFNFRKSYLLSVLRWIILLRCIFSKLSFNRDIFPVSVRRDVSFTTFFVPSRMDSEFPWKEYSLDGVHHR